jgi:hypothetical protein
LSAEEILTQSGCQFSAQACVSVYRAGHLLPLPLFVYWPWCHCRFASGVLTVSFTFRQRSNDLDAGKEDGEGGGPELDGTPGTPATGSAHTPHSLERADSLQRQLDSSSGNSSVGSSAGMHRKLSRMVSTCAPIPEDVQGSESDTAAVRDQSASGAGGSAGEAGPKGRSSLDEQRLVRPTGLLRVQSFTAQGR